MSTLTIMMLSELEKLKALIHELNNKFITTKKELDDLKTSIIVDADGVQDIKKENDALSYNLLELQNKYDELDAKANNYKQLYDAKSSESDELQNKVANLRSENKALLHKNEISLVRAKTVLESLVALDIDPNTAQ